MNDPRPAGQDRRELGITGPPATPATKVGRWFNLGFFSFFLAPVANRLIADLQIRGDRLHGPAGLQQIQDTEH
jgi:hypothetical protein